MQTEGTGIIAVTTGYWSTNIGNAFFQLSGHYILTQTARQHRVIPLADQPGFGSCRKPQKPKHSLDLLGMVNCEYVVLQGSILNRFLPVLWKEAFEIYKQKNIKIIFLGVGQLDYSREETQQCRAFLRQYRPYLFVSRDSVAYERFGDLAVHAYNGIDNAFFLPLAFPKVLLLDIPYLILNFDKGPEPILRFSSADAAAEDSGGQEIFFDNERLQIRFPRLKTWVGRKVGKYYRYVSALLPRISPPPSHAGPYQIIRLDNQMNPLLNRKLYSGPHSFAMDVPYGFLTLLANTSLTLSDRIHSCIASLAYGNPAMLFSQSPRRQILSQVGVSQITEHPVTADLHHLETLRQNELNFLTSCFRNS